MVSIEMSKAIHNNMININAKERNTTDKYPDRLKVDKKNCDNKR